MEFDMTQHNFRTPFEYNVDWVNKGQKGIWFDV
jgi:hypothetical protein